MAGGYRAYRRAEAGPRPGPDRTGTNPGASALRGRVSDRMAGRSRTGRPEKGKRGGAPAALALQCHSAEKGFENGPAPQPARPGPAQLSPAGRRAGAAAQLAQRTVDGAALVPGGRLNDASVQESPTSSRNHVTLMHTERSYLNPKEDRILLSKASSKGAARRDGVGRGAGIFGPGMTE